MTRLLVLNLVTGEPHRYAPPDYDRDLTLLPVGDLTEYAEMPCDPWLFNTFAAAESYRVKLERRTRQPHIVLPCLEPWYTLGE